MRRITITLDDYQYKKLETIRYNLTKLTGKSVTKQAIFDRLLLVHLEGDTERMVAILKPEFE